jgi:dTDP-6-deoxy-L-talose 4-dehydrogenase (NAD+)
MAEGREVALTAGNQVRDFLDVREAGQRIAKVAISNITGPINICSGTPATVREIAESIADEYGRRDLLKFGARPENPVDPAFIVGVPSPL